MRRRAVLTFLLVLRSLAVQAEPLSSRIYHAEKLLDARLNSMLRCIAIPGVSKVAIGSDCRSTADYFKTEPFHWEDQTWYLHDEWRVRTKLVDKGLILPREICPADYAYYEQPDREVMVVFTGAQSPSSIVSSDFTRLLTIGWRSKALPPEVMGPGVLPLSEAIVFGRTKKDKKWIELARMPVDMMPIRGISQKFMEPSAEMYCPKFNEIDSTRLGVCFSDHYGMPWPELTFWTIEAYSTSLPTIYTFPEDAYVKAVNGNVFFKKVDGEWHVVSGMNREAYDTVWFNGSDVAAMKMDKRTGKFFKDQNLTNRIFKFPRIIIGSRPGIPKDVGRYCQMKESTTCVEVTK